MKRACRKRKIFFFEGNSEIKDPSKTVRLNRHYGSLLGWSQYYEKINELLLPLSGMENVSLGEEAFARAVAAWQQQQGMTADGIIGPNTWNQMKKMLSGANPLPHVPVLPISTAAPATQDPFEFNRWHAQKILDTMNAGITGTNFKSKEQLKKIVRGEQVFNIDPTTKPIQILPIVYHITDRARSENYNGIIIGSFIRKPDSQGKCIGHCAGRCIDINFRGGSFETKGAVQMVINILRYLLSLPAQYKKGFGFGLPLQGDFFGKKDLAKFTKTNPSNLVDFQLRELIPQLGIVFPDNDNHLHIQVKWE